jgi:hypothetical protein
MDREEIMRALARIRADREVNDAERARIDLFEVETVQAARLLGLSWNDLADALGRSRPGIWQKHRHSTI